MLPLRRRTLHYKGLHPPLILVSPDMILISQRKEGAILLIQATNPQKQGWLLCRNTLFLVSQENGKYQAFWCGRLIALEGSHDISSKQKKEKNTFYSEIIYQIWQPTQTWVDLKLISRQRGERGGVCGGSKKMYSSFRCGVRIHKIILREYLIKIKTTFKLKIKKLKGKSDELFKRLKKTKTFRYIFSFIS